ncbi:MAG: iron-containing alcohol dehydrogenase [Bacteroidota bacterium]
MANHRHTFTYPTRIEYGPNAMKDFTKIVQEKGLKKGLIVTDKGIEKVGTANQLKDFFTDVSVESVIFNNVKSNPTEENVLEGTKVYKDENCDFIVALGGGSPIDAGKTIKVMATHNGPLAKYDDMKGGDKYIVDNMPPFYAIPTTAGTGSEVGRSSVININDKKVIIYSPFMMPDIAVLDPLITVSLPSKLTAATGVDAFVHSLEAYIMETYHPMADAIAKEAMEMCVKNLEIAVNKGSDIIARGNMLMASAMGAIAFQKGLGLNHAIAHGLGVFYDMHHGLANAVVLTEVMKYNISRESTRKRYASLGSIFGVENDADSVIEAVGEWLKSVGIDVSLTDLNVEESQFQKLEEYALADPCCPLNPKEVEKGDVVRILNKLI